MGHKRLPKKLRDQLPTAELTYHGFGKGAAKYGNRSCTCRAGHNHRSIFEASYCNDLRLLVKAGEVARYEVEHKIEIYVRGKKICNHFVDFFVIYTDGRAEYHETKGFDTDVWKLKRRLVEALNPDTPYRVVREKDTFNKARGHFTR